MGGLSGVLVTLNRTLRDLTWTATAWKLFVWAELHSEFGGVVPLEQRIRWWGDEFLTASGVLYDFEDYEIDDFVTDIGYFNRLRLNGPEGVLVDHKEAAHRLLAPTHSHALPALFGIVDRDVARGDDGRVLSSAPMDWIRETVTEQGRVVLKPEDGSSGEDVFVIERSDGGLETNGETGLSPVRDSLSGLQRYLVTEFVEQHPYADEIYPHTANTIRLITCRDTEEGEPFIADAIHRIGTDESRPVDNWDKGGLSAGIDLDTGTLQQATRFPDSRDLDWFDRHPGTDARITGTTIPSWDTVTSAVKEMAERLYWLELIAWDIVVTEDGYTVIEANDTPTLNMHQVHRPLIRDDRTRRFFERHDMVS